MAVVEAIAGLGFTTPSYPKLTAARGCRSALKATQRVAARVGGLLGAKADAQAYARLFELRSLLLHGRPLQPISGADRVEARRLARRIVFALVARTSSIPVTSRENTLDLLLGQGVALRALRMTTARGRDTHEKRNAARRTVGRHGPGF